MTSRVSPEQSIGLVDVLRPVERVASLGAADRHQVVQVVRAVLGHAQPSRLIREEEVHLRRRLGLGRQLEDDPHAVDHQLLAGLDDLLGRRDQPRRRDRNRLAESAVDVRPRSGLAAAHRTGTCRACSSRTRRSRSRQRFMQEVLRRDHPTAPAATRRARHPEHAAEVIGVRVGVDHRDHRRGRRDVRSRAPGSRERTPRRSADRSRSTPSRRR